MQNGTLPEQGTGQIRKYRRGEVITAEGETKRAGYVILEGSVEIFQHRKSIRVLRTGDVFGPLKSYQFAFFASLSPDIWR